MWTARCSRRRHYSPTPDSPISVRFVAVHVHLNVTYWSLRRACCLMIYIKWVAVFFLSQSGLKGMTGHMWGVRPTGKECQCPAWHIDTMKAHQWTNHQSSGSEPRSNRKHTFRQSQLSWNKCHHLQKGWSIQSWCHELLQQPQASSHQKRHEKLPKTRLTVGLSRGTVKNAPRTRRSMGTEDTCRRETGCGKNAISVQTKEIKSKSPELPLAGLTESSKSPWPWPRVGRYGRRTTFSLAM